MKLSHFNAYFFFLLLTGVGVVMFFIFQPFLTAILAAAILAALFQGWYQALLRWTRNQHALSAMLAILLIATVIITPLIIIFGVAFNELNIAYDNVVSGGASGQVILTRFFDAIQSLPYANFFLHDQALSAQGIIQNLRNFSQDILGFVQVLYQSIVHFIIWLLVMLFTLFYFFIDGKRIVQYLMNITPLRDEHEKLLIDKFVSMSRATLRGTLMIGIVQGVLGGIMFAIAGIPSPVIWGLIMTVLSVIPMVGASIIWVPVSLVLLFIGDVWQGMFMLLFGFGVISTIDNVLRPKLVGRDTQMHPLMIFFATLGGIGLFGFPGFIIGPIIASLGMALLDIYTIEFKSQLKTYNE